MKSLLIILLLFVSYSATAQTQAAPFKGANAIQVTVADSGATTWKRTAQSLIAHGYAIKSSDKDLLSITTDSKDCGRAGSVSISAVIIGNRVTLRGTQLVPLFDPMPTALEYRGMNKSIIMLGFKQLEVIAKDLGGKIEYATR